MRNQFIFATVDDFLSIVDVDAGIVVYEETEKEGSVSVDKIKERTVLKDLLSDEDFFAKYKDAMIIGLGSCENNTVTIQVRRVIK